jgi:hypothetical protein
MAVQAALPVKKMPPAVFQSSAAPVLSVEERKQAAIAKSEKTRLENEKRHTTFHPVQGYKLVRTANPVHMDAAQHRSAKINRDFAGERRIVKAAVAAIAEEKLFAQHFRKRYCDATDESAPDVDADNQPVSNHLLSLEQAIIADAIEREARFMAVEAMPFVDPLYSALDPAAAEARLRRTAEKIKASTSDAAIMLSARVTRSPIRRVHFTLGFRFAFQVNLKPE